jgi:hypothetical protein
MGAQQMAQCATGAGFSSSGMVCSCQREEAMTLRSLTSLRWHYPDQVVRVFLSLQRRAPRVKIVKLLSVVEFTATHRFIQQAFSPGYDTFAAIMLIRRPGGIAFRCWRAENNDIMRYLAYRGYTPWPFITMRWY